MDADLVANEIIDSKVQQRKLDILCKLDIEKTYDHVNWSTCYVCSRSWALAKTEILDQIFYIHC